MLELDVPAVTVPREGRIGVRTPRIPGVREWFFDQLGWRTDMGADPDRWCGVTLARRKLDEVIDILLARWGAVDLYREYDPEAVCTPSCRRAQGVLCLCPCSGEQHGTLSTSPESGHVPGEFELLGFSDDEHWSLTRLLPT